MSGEQTVDIFPVIYIYFYNAHLPASPGGCCKRC
jgi:hypothetical protein